MIILKRYRLLNVAQVRGTCGDTSLELRPDTVEVTADRDEATLVLSRLFDRSLSEMPDPILVARLTLSGRPKIIKPFEINDTRWVVQSASGTVSISPYKSDHIFSDPTFDGRSPLEKDPSIAVLEERRRSVLFSLLANRSYLRTTPPDHVHAARTCRTTIEIMEQQLNQLDEQIEVCHGR